MNSKPSAATAKFDDLVREMQEFGAEHLIAIGLKDDGSGGYDVRGFGTLQDKEFTCEVLRQMLASMERS
ncbi:hypothetical protein [Denitrobaculum tricleocarpae]|uniref:Uncharacterized protein n=1 Tax=Denitrobaculum tricleocarpae TaxID=2591009 RepID=A0A545TAZ4_9PROT|nr:hypothetical protein [Denitrobaculum tricleocarpae]TQV74371.1 hypothetical protein FKG95_24115 [Denitrobaculum tricleocarpae]